jgi:hypothetical protein
MSISRIAKFTLDKQVNVIQVPIGTAFKSPLFILTEPKFSQVTFPVISSFIVEPAGKASLNVE